ncbi:MAG TPA: magnesium transporter CorA family protein [Burkholderiaceae bacterium]|nr:magnesium transporter CorA family protein [Burkholderiaceae bacterium]
MRAFHVAADRFTELPGLPAALPETGFVWVGITRPVFEAQVAHVQEHLQRWEGGPLVDLHVSDLLNAQLRSQFDTTSWYDVLVFRRLAASAGSGHLVSDDAPGSIASARQMLDAIDTSPVGFAVFDRVLLTVHPADCAVREHFAHRLAQLAGPEPRTLARLPATPADLMLRMVNHMVDSYLDLRRLLTRQLGFLQRELLDPKSRFHDWSLLLDARNALHLLEDTCEDQRSALQEWIDAVDEWPQPEGAVAQRERDVLRVRSRDVLEHIERVLSHVRRLGQSAEAAVQMHFSALSHRTNDIMRTLTVLTAIFLPLNLITGFFGMNFDAMPLIHTHTGIWITVGLMALVGGGLGAFFWRKRYLGSRTR